MLVKYHKFWLVNYHNISSLDMVVCFDLSSTLHAIFKGNELQNLANLNPMPPNCTKALNLNLSSKSGTKYFLNISSSLKFEITVYFSGFHCQFIQGH